MRDDFKDSLLRKLRVFILFDALSPTLHTKTIIKADEDGDFGKRFQKCRLGNESFLKTRFACGRMEMET